jgi:hypothetical protein
MKEPDFRFYVEGLPATQGSKQFVDRHYCRDSCKRLEPWRKQVGVMARLGCPWHVPIAERRFDLGMVFVLPRPAGHFGTGRNRWILKESAPKDPIVVPDLIKMARAVEDAMSGIVYKDDCQVCEYREFRKRYAMVGEKMGVEVSVWLL